MKRILLPLSVSAALFVTIGARPLTAVSQARDAAAVLREMRVALGGDTVLDGITSLTINGRLTRTTSGFTSRLSVEQFILLPDQFLEIQRGSDSMGPRSIDVTSYRGFRGDVLLRRTDSNIPMPPDPWPASAAAEREREIMLANKRSFARLGLMLFSRSFSVYPMKFDNLGIETRDGRTFEVLDATGADGYRMQLFVDAATHLPATIEFPGQQVVRTAMTSVAVTRGNSVVSESPAQPSAPVDVRNSPAIQLRLTASNFKAQDGVTWPRRLVESGSITTWDTELSRFELNPRFDAKRFEVGR